MREILSSFSQSVTVLSGVQFSNVLYQAAWLCVTKGIDFSIGGIVFSKRGLPTEFMLETELLQRLATHHAERSALV